MQCCTICKIFMPKEGTEVCCPRCLKSKGAYHDQSCRRTPCRANPDRGCSACQQRKDKAKMESGGGARVYPRRGN